MQLSIGILLLCVGSLHATSFKLWESSSRMDQAQYNYLLKQRALLPTWMKIFPGTKWCGDGDMASTYDDLGEEIETDVCCRAHDYCEDILEGKETKYGLTNDAFHSKVSCECDVTFYNCLKEADTPTSRSVGTLYFTLLGTQCFKEEYPVKECLKYSYFPWKKCIEYDLDTTQTKVHQWFDIPNF